MLIWFIFSFWIIRTGGWPVMRNIFAMDCGASVISCNRTHTHTSFIQNYSRKHSTSEWNRVQLEAWKVIWHAAVVWIFTWQITKFAHNCSAFYPVLKSFRWCGRPQTFVYSWFGTLVWTWNLAVAFEWAVGTASTSAGLKSITTPNMFHLFARNV